MSAINEDEEKITKPQARAALLRSGYLLEGRIESSLSRRGYYVDANSIYLDPITQKAREIDLYALGAERVWKEDNFIFPCLLIECINNPQPVAFFTKDPQVPFTFHYDVHISGIPVKLLSQDGKSWEIINESIRLNRYHHYCKGRVSTQFCSFSKKKRQRRRLDGLA